MQTDDPSDASGCSVDRTQDRWNDLMQFFHNWPKPWITAASFQLVFVVGIIDFVTGYEVSVSPLYLLPVALSTWFAGRATGGSVAAFSTAVWFTADMLGRPHYRHPLTPVWNAVIMGLWFAVVVILLLALKQKNVNLEQTVVLRTEKLQGEIEERRRAEELLTRSNTELTVIREQLQQSLAELQQSHAELQQTQLRLIEAAKR